MIFQDPYSSLNPRKSVGQIVARAVRDPSHREERQGPRAGAARRASGSARSTTTATRTSSRAGSGSASASRARSRSQPKLIVCDEPVSALDVSVQAQILNLLQGPPEGVRADLRLHLARPVRDPADRPTGSRSCTSGGVVEIGDSEPLYDAPAHPYTAALLSAVPRPARTAARPATAHRARAATCPRRSTRRRRACSIRAARASTAATATSRHRSCASFDADQEAACHYPLERWPMTDDELRQAEGATAQTGRTSRAHGRRLIPAVECGA